MIAKQITIQNPTGLHTRPANDFVTLANTFDCTITVTKGDKSANAKSIIKLLRIGISQHDTITLQTDGTDEERAMQGLTDFLFALKE